MDVPRTSVNGVVDVSVHKVKKNGEEDWKTIQEAANTIYACSGPQFAREMLLEGGAGFWYWIPPGGAADSHAYSPSDMVTYLRNNELQSSVFVCRSLSQNQVPDRSSFKTVGELTDDYIQRKTAVREATATTQVHVSSKDALSVASAETPTEKADENQQKRNESQEQDVALSQACEPHNGSPFGNTPNFVELERRYRTSVFKDTSKEWYINVSDGVHGPYSCSQLLGWSQKDGLPIQYKLASVEIGGPQPSQFTDLMELLLRAYRDEAGGNNLLASS